MKRLLLLILLCPLSMSAQKIPNGYARNTWVYDNSGVLLTNCKESAVQYRIEIYESNEKFDTRFKIVSKGISYYADEFILQGDDKLRIMKPSKYGGFEIYSFIFGEFKIYQKKRNYNN